MIKSAIVDIAIKKYNLPEWIRPYLIKYAKRTSLMSLKRARSFVEVGRKRGAVTDNYVVFPNGVKMKIAHLMRIINCYYNAENMLSMLSQEWATVYPDVDRSHNTHFELVSEMEAGHARALKNLIEGLGGEIEKPSAELVGLMEYMRPLKKWEERIVAKRLILHYTYAKAFGQLIYRVFYPVSPELMRSLSAAFRHKPRGYIYTAAYAEELIRSGAVEQGRLLELSDGVLIRAAKAINVELRIIVNDGLGDEVELLRDVAIAYPLHRIKELGVKFDVDGEIMRVKESIHEKR